jgi:alanine-glyoxylate transaminase / (R)-3-amino-2-methylpropionate-pyruvate transaminase
MHFNTFGGNPVSMAQGMATLDVILEENIQQRAKVVGGAPDGGLRDLQKRHKS